MEMIKETNTKGLNIREVELLEDMQRIMRTSDEMINGWEHRRQMLIHERNKIEEELDMLNRRIEDQRTYSFNQLEMRARYLSDELDNKLNG